MDISRKTDYALRILALLVRSGSDAPVSVRAAADEVDVPYSFARSIQRGLVEADIIESRRGVCGGMRLKADPARTTMLDIVRAVQGPLSVNDCTAPGGECPRSKGCCFHPIWCGAQSLLDGYLGSITLEDAICGRYPAIPSIGDAPSPDVR